MMTKEEAIKYFDSRCDSKVAGKILDGQGLTPLRSGFRPTGRGCERCGKEENLYWQESLYVYRQHAIVLNFERPFCAYCGKSIEFATCVRPNQEQVDAFRAEVDKKLDGAVREAGPHEKRCGDVRSILREEDSGMDEVNENVEGKSAKDRVAGCLVDLLTRVTRDTAEAMRITGELMGGMLEIIREECTWNRAMLESELEAAERQNVSDHHEVGEWEAWAVRMLGQSDVPLTNGELRTRLTDKLCNARVRALQKEIEGREHASEVYRKELVDVRNDLGRWQTWACELLKRDAYGQRDGELRGRIADALVNSRRESAAVEDHNAERERYRDALIDWRTWAVGILNGDWFDPALSVLSGNEELRRRLKAPIDALDKLRSVADEICAAVKVEE